MITEIAHRKVSSLHVGGQTLKKKGLNHLRLALLPMTFYRMRHAMKQTHPKKNSTLSYHELFHKRQPQRPDGW